MRRTTIAVIIAFAMIAGWGLRIGAEMLPGWDSFGVLVAVLIFSALTDVADRGIDKAIKAGKS